MLVVFTPWTIGLLLRINERYRALADRQRQTEAEAEWARNLARLRSRQTQLANDVHDVVGHSLAVIIAQADSAQALSDHQVARLREVMANISVSARRSLNDVRQVLRAQQTSPEQADGLQHSPSDLDSLIEGVRAAGHDVRSTVNGQTRPLTPETETIAYRTLQEMLTNALKHGMKTHAIHVRRDWEQNELRLTVRNCVVGPRRLNPRGMGLSGMQQRLDGIGGHLTVESVDTGEPEQQYTITAGLPLRQMESSQ
ncbi:sensor histidine kinase (plasmid) [Streptomyces sp. AHU1]|uniref:sensor histidine kinase n=1 Tax=Streptomyces sp. AHU1 TaxID=3377215 RepID=UPI00387802E6